MSTALPLYVKLELRAITNSQRSRDNPVVISSTIPSAKYSCSGSPDMFVKGRTATDGLLGRDRGLASGAPVVDTATSIKYPRFGTVLMICWRLSPKARRTSLMQTGNE